MVSCLGCWQVDWLTAQLVGWHGCRKIGSWLGGCVVTCFFHDFVGWLASWRFGWAGSLVGWLAGWATWLAASPAGWPAGWLTGWLAR